MTFGKIFLHNANALNADYSAAQRKKSMLELDEMQRFTYILTLKNIY